MPWCASPAGALAGCITVYATMPFDNLKTGLQSSHSRALYLSGNSSLRCLRLVLRDEGVLALWKGTTPRLVRLCVSGAISFSIYEKVLAWTRAAVAVPDVAGAESKASLQDQRTAALEMRHGTSHGLRRKRVKVVVQ